MKNIFKYIIVLLILTFNIYGTEVSRESIENSSKMSELKEELNNVNKDLKKNIWITKYNNYLTYRKIEKALIQIKKDATKYSRWKGEKYKELSYQLNNKIRIKENELEFISEYKDSPIGKQITPLAIGKVPTVTNPFSIIEALSYRQMLNENVENYKQIHTELLELVDQINHKLNISKSLYLLTKDKDLVDEINKLELQLKNFIMVVDIVSTTDDVYNKKVRQTTQEVNDAISEEMWRTFKLLILILLLFIFSIGIKKQ